MDRSSIRMREMCVVEVGMVGGAFRKIVLNMSATMLEHCPTPCTDVVGPMTVTTRLRARATHASCVWSPCRKYSVVNEGIIKDNKSLSTAMQSSAKSYISTSPMVPSSSSILASAP
jgi:hypothetical protein